MNFMQAGNSYDNIDHVHVAMSLTFHPHLLLDENV